MKKNIHNLFCAFRKWLICKLIVNKKGQYVVRKNRIDINIRSKKDIKILLVKDVLDKYFIL